MLGANSNRPPLLANGHVPVAPQIMSSSRTSASTPTSPQNATARLKLRVNAAPATPSTPLDDVAAAKKNGGHSSSPKQPKAKMVLRPTPEQQEREEKMESQPMGPTRSRSATPIPTAYVARPDTSIRMIAEGDEEGESDPSIPQVRRGSRVHLQ